MKRKFVDALNFNLMDGKFFVAKEDRVEWIRNTLLFRVLQFYLVGLLSSFQKGKDRCCQGKEIKN